MIARFWDHLTSTRFALILFGILSVLSLLGTFPGLEGVYRHPGFRLAIGLLGFCTFACTLRRWRTVKWPVLIIHSGVILTLAGGMVSWLGYVATVNAYEGDTVTNFFRWDVEQDLPLGFDLTINRIHTDYFPIPIKVGVLQGGEKKELFITKTGDSFRLDRYRIMADRLDPVSGKLQVTVFDHDNAIGTADTDGASDLPADFPYQFKLVAFKNPILKRMWVEIGLKGAGLVPVAGTSEVNAPLQWNGLSFYCTQVSHDPSGRHYAGIQVVKDPGRPLVFGGMFVTSLGGLCAFARRKVWS